MGLEVGDTADLDLVVTRLVAAGYSRVDVVERRGEIAVRGGILDVFPPTEDHPLRVEFFGDEVFEIRVFKAADQRSLSGDDAMPHRLWAPPCRELLLTPDVLDRAATLARAHPQLADILGKVAHGIAVEGMESLAPVLVDRMDLLLDELPPDAMVLVCDPERVRARAAELVRTGEEFLLAAWAGAASGGAAPVDLSAAALRPLADVRARANALGIAWWSVSPLAAAGSDETTDADDAVLVIDASSAASYRGDTQESWPTSRVGWQMAGGCCSPRQVMARRNASPGLGGEGVAARLESDLVAVPEPGAVVVSCGSLDGGFVAAGRETGGAYRSRRVRSTRSHARLAKLPSRPRHTVDCCNFNRATGRGEAHGVGRFVEMVQRTVAVLRANIWYWNTRPANAASRAIDSTSTDSLDQVTRYVGGDKPNARPHGRCLMGETQGWGAQGCQGNRG